MVVINTISAPTQIFLVCSALRWNALGKHCALRPPTILEKTIPVAGVKLRSLPNIITACVAWSVHANAACSETFIYFVESTKTSFEATWQKWHVRPATVDALTE